ncbi:DUF2384 domain-containing protein [Thalassotalea euphylliae]|uniref:DUF2384 domain-containing protein n=1 Tax=Thalassotalea euphylliae TaxID=1655234 RepID=A0A3E0TTK3_9GAMM|nr:antitoxin Xre-like helix-turn-helix domain-containing protein [Thalassotalea euphylliae]REL27754.1 DUF2384 domain-containing protein [Thalassotalea euphylliae]
MLLFTPKPDEVPTFWDSVGIPARGIELYTALNDGLPFEVYGRIAKHTKLDKKEIASALHLAPATVARRAKSGYFSREEGDRLYRLAAVLNAANELFEHDMAAAVDWLKHPARGLGNKKPIEMLRTTAESEAILDLIGRLEHGVVV